MSDSGLADIRLAAQYLAAAGISFLEKQADDSHTNLGYSEEEHQLFSRPLNASGDFLALDLLNFALKWVTASGSSHYMLDGKSHAEILEWLKSKVKNDDLSSEYQYSFHYDLSCAISDTYVFKMNEEALQLERDLRGLANRVLSHVLSEYSMESDIRIWPHHFDTGAFAQLPGSGNVSLGIGLAIPDSLVDQYYFYISGYMGHESLSTASFKPLSNGQWLNDGLKGGVLPAVKLDENTVIRYFKEAIANYSKPN